VRLWAPLPLAGEGFGGEGPMHSGYFLISGQRDADSG